jgi:hypothetical protein
MAHNPEVYATVQDLATVLGGVTGQDDRLTVALILASRWVDYHLGKTVTDHEVDWTAPITLDVVDSRPSVHLATIAAAVRFYKSPDVPWGVAGGLGDVATYVKTTMPEVALILLGQREAWGIA